MAGAGKKYYINIEGVEYPRDSETISVKDMRALAKLPGGLAIVEEFPDGSEKNRASPRPPRQGHRPTESSPE